MKFNNFNVSIITFFNKKIKLEILAERGNVSYNIASNAVHYVLLSCVLFILKNIFLFNTAANQQKMFSVPEAARVPHFEKP